MLDEEVGEVTEEPSRLSQETGVTEAMINDFVGQMLLDAYRPTGNLRILSRELQKLRDFINDLNRAITRRIL